ncbi:Na/Pi cotransporter family protein [Paenibacillus sp. IB182496]|uniref:Na/Pi cotransporter family protein n=1 Tax=Paenibacillus sabuli TaxID=2772509 RepID=A0A927BS21_9BACL|nr:Na/Pi symporter [Paenibacillus sabuli]MBD2844464.1 Na/Pi cotransporter family protein [Paenibacillus sabuli]
MLAMLLPTLLGFAVFMLGMKIMELALYRWAGPSLSVAIRSGTATPLRGMLVSAGATAVLQSSTAVTVIAIGLVNARLLSYRRTLGIILGTNIGSCVTTELIGLRLDRLAPPLLACSLAAWLLTALLDEYGLHPAARAPAWLRPMRYGAVACAGFALLVQGIGIMQSIAPHLETSPLLGALLSRASERALVGLALGAVLAALLHSSAAAIGLVMGLVLHGTMPPEAGIAFVLGANVGTCATALLASLGGSASGRFVAWTHTLLNVGGAALCLPFLGALQTVSAALAHDPASQIAHAQTIFNVASSLLALPLCYLPALRSRAAAD